MTVNIYCDESCHLEHESEVMVIGGIYLPEQNVKSITQDIRRIKEKHNISPYREIKWTKVSVAKCDYYLDLVDYFFNNELLSFRAVVIPDKSKLDHGKYNQTYDEFYYKMYYLTLTKLLSLHDDIKAYIDIKDTNGAEKVNNLKKYLNYKAKNSEKIKKIQQIRSHESTVLQLTDLLIGAVSYINRSLHGNEAKVKICRLIQERTHQDLVTNSYYSESKFNVLIFNGGE